MVSRSVSCIASELSSRTRGKFVSSLFVTFHPRLERFRRWFVRHAMRAVYKASAGALCPPARLPAADIHRILVCRSVRTLGDSLTLTPLLEELEVRIPGAEVDLMSRCPVADRLYGKRFNVGNVMRVPAHAAGHPLRTARALAGMRRRRYDLVIDPDPQSQSGRLLALLANTRWSLGFAGPHKSGALTHVVDSAGCPRHKAKAAMYLLRRALGAALTEDVYPRLTLRLDEAELRSGREMLARLVGNAGGSKPCIGVFANATGAKRFARSWWDRFLAVVEQAAPDCAFIEVLPATGVSLLGARYPCFYSSDVRKMAAVMARLALFVGADCGVMHLASAAGAPTIGLFSVTDPDEWGPYGDQDRALVVTGCEPEQVAAQTIETLKALCGQRG